MVILFVIVITSYSIHYTKLYEKEYQQKLYDQELAKENATVSTLVAKPGNSEHHSGYAVDLALYRITSYNVCYTKLLRASQLL